ncbi:MAG: glycoside hydrolase family 5 protein, partial [Oscillospiraceae bacterium]|nr:glycoside hydrolase family 5 protein [Oscillospiraceae bacterium]
PIPTPDTPELDGKARIMDFKELTAAQLMAEMDAGWNLGNTMDALRSVYGLPTQHETAWGNPVTTPEMIQLLADTGFSTLRIPVTWEPHIGPDYTINAGWLDRVQEIVDYGIDCGLYVIINMHHEEWHFPSVENVEEAEAFLTAVWAQIAARFGGYSEKLIFEGLNEPRMKGTPQEWSGGTEQARAVINKWNLAFVQTIRAGAGHNDKRWLMVPTIAASADETPLKGFVKPRDDKVIVSIHSYTPYNFALNTRALQDTAFDPSNPAHTNDIDAMLKRLDTYFVSKGIPVVIGETGCLNKGNPEDRVNWAGYYSGKAASYGIPCIWWDNGIQQSSTGEAFGIMDRRNAEWWFPEIAEAFINARKQ